MGGHASTRRSGACLILYQNVHANASPQAPLISRPTLTTSTLTVVRDAQLHSLHASTERRGSHGRLCVLAGCTVKHPDLAQSSNRTNFNTAPTVAHSTTSNTEYGSIASH